MRASILLPLALALSFDCALERSLAAETRPDTPVLKDAYAILRVDDARWVDRQVAQFAAACGQDPAPARERMARALFCCSSSAGVDMQRPALVAWRPGRAPLIAIVPIANRRAFVDAFGALPFGEAPLVRVADREGTVVYSQNHGGGRDEYRLLVSDNTAYLARNVDECRQLAAHPPVYGADQALGFSAWGPFADELPLGLRGALALDGRLAMPKALGVVAEVIGAQARASLPPQIASLDWRIKVAPNGAAIWTGSLQAAPDSALAEWLRAQSNQGGRLGAALPDDAIVRVQGQAAWQGQCDTFGHQLEPAMQARVGAAWTPAVAEAWTAAWSALDHAGGFALGVRARGGGAAALEHPQADLVATQAAAVEAALEGRPAEKDAAQPLWRLGDDHGSAAIAVGDRQVAWAQDADGGAAATAQAVLGRAAAAATSGDPALATASFDFTRLITELFEDRLDPEVPLPRVVVQLVVKGGHDEIQAQCDLPLGDASTLLTKVNWK